MGYENYFIASVIESFTTITFTYHSFIEKNSLLLLLLFVNIERHTLPGTCQTAPVNSLVSN